VPSSKAVRGDGATAGSRAQTLLGQTCIVWGQGKAAGNLWLAPAKSMNMMGKLTPDEILSLLKLEPNATCGFVNSAFRYSAFGRWILRPNAHAR
jgi:hypothetical protein